MPSDEATTAYHEAGHVLLAWLCGGVVRETSIESEADELHGHTSVEWHGLDDDERARCSAIVALAGPVAEAIWRGSDVPDPSAWRADWEEARLCFELTDSELRPEEQIRRTLADLARTLNDPATWEQLCRIADALEAHGTLDAYLLEDVLPPRLT